MYSNAVKFVAVLAFVYVLILNVSSVPVSDISSTNPTTSISPLETEETAANVTKNATRKDL